MPILPTTLQRHPCPLGRQHYCNKDRLNAALDREIVERDDVEAVRQARDVANRAREKALVYCRIAQEENDRFREQCVNFQGRVNEQTERITEMEEGELEMRGRMVLMHVDLAVAKGREIEMTGQMLAVEAELEEVKGQMAVVGAELATAKGQMPVLEAELATVKGQMTVVEAELATAKWKESEMKGQMAVVEAELATAKWKESEMTGQMTVVEAELATDKERETGITAELALVREREAAITAELALVQERVTDLERSETASTVHMIQAEQ